MEGGGSGVPEGQWGTCGAVGYMWGSGVQGGSGVHMGHKDAVGYTWGSGVPSVPLSPSPPRSCDVRCWPSSYSGATFFWCLSTLEKLTSTDPTRGSKGGGEVESWGTWTCSDVEGVAYIPTSFEIL